MHCKAHNWDMTKWSLNRGCLLIEVKMHYKATDQVVSEYRWSLNTGGHKSRFHCN